MQTLRQVQQEGRQTFLGAHAAQQQHHPMVAHNLAAHDLVELVLQVRELARQLLELPIRNHAHLRVFQGDGVAGMSVGADAVQAQQLASHLETGDLIAAIFGRHARLEEPGAHGIHRAERVAAVKEGIAALDRAARGHQRVEMAQLRLAQANGQAQLAQIAAGAGHLEGVQLDATTGSLSLCGFTLLALRLIRGRAGAGDVGDRKNTVQHEKPQSLPDCCRNDDSEIELDQPWCPRVWHSR